MTSPYSIYLGQEDRLGLLYSYPNARDRSWSLAATILHWFNLTLQRDGMATLGVRAAIRVEGSANNASYFLDLTGPSKIASRLPEYGHRIPQFLDNGWSALNTVIPRIKEAGRWDPDPDPGSDYRPWRFFLPLGMAMINQRSLQFFHYAPVRLLEEFQDYLHDPVPVRWNELLSANGVTRKGDLPLYSSVVDAAPIAAEDTQGSKNLAEYQKRGWMGLIPIEYFNEYQRAQVKLLLNASTESDYTIPIVVYGNNPTAQFGSLFGVDLKASATATAHIIPGKKTAVLGTSHPYNFYFIAQQKNASALVGSGSILPENLEEAKQELVKNLTAARWQKIMSDDPSRDPGEVLEEAKAYWTAPSRAAEVCTLLQHQGSLLYPNPQSLDFQFRISMAQATAACTQASSRQGPL